MHYILSKDIALRSWNLVPFAYLKKGYSHAIGLSQEEFEILLQCDSKTNIADSPIVKKLLRQKLIYPCDNYEISLDPWQQYKRCNNRYMPMLNLQITGKCNYNCRHCFNCKDNTPLQSEMSIEQITRLLDECVDAGVTSFTITGGEPFLHPHFIEIIKEIYQRNLFVFELNTNGYFINEKILDELIDIGCHAEIKISFDGIGHHDWMRHHKGAEEKTIEAIKLCIQKGFDVRVQMNANKENKDSIYPTLCFLDEIGVLEVRLIKTTDAPRWQQNAKGLDFSWEEYYDFLVELFNKYAHEEHKLSIDVWQTLYYNAENHYYNIGSLTDENFDEEEFICKDGRKMAALASNGEVYPCMQMQGFMIERGISFGNVFSDSLQSILSNSKLLDYICLDIKERLKQNNECKECAYLKYCHGGCPALAMLTHDNNFNCYLASDKTKCILLKNGYYKKLITAFGKENRNTSCD